MVRRKTKLHPEERWWRRLSEKRKLKLENQFLKSPKKYGRSFNIFLLDKYERRLAKKRRK